MQKGLFQKVVKLINPNPAEKRPYLWYKDKNMNTQPKHQYHKFLNTAQNARTATRASLISALQEEFKLTTEQAESIYQEWIDNNK